MGLWGSLASLQALGVCDPGSNPGSPIVLNIHFFLGRIMDTVQYALKSNPRLVVDVPAEYARVASDLLARPPVQRGLVLALKRVDCPYLGNPGVAAGLLSLSAAEPNTEPYLRQQDDFFLRVCIAGLDTMANGPESEAAFETRERLIDVNRRTWARSA